MSCENKLLQFDSWTMPTLAEVELKINDNLCYKAVSICFLKVWLVSLTMQFLALCNFRPDMKHRRAWVYLVIAKFVSAQATAVQAKWTQTGHVEACHSVLVCTGVYSPQPGVRHLILKGLFTYLPISQKYVLTS